MKKFFRSIVTIGAMLGATLSLSGCGFGFVETGQVGVRTAYGKIQSDEVSPGFYTAILSSVDKYTVKETSVELRDMKPRAKDNLTLKDLDVTVYYTTNPGRVAEFASEKGGQSARMEGESFLRPGYMLVQKLAQGAAQDAVSHLDSLTLHQNRTALEDAIVKATQAELDKATHLGDFTVTRAVVTSVQTDPAVEESIRRSIQVQKDVETATQQVKVKQQEAEAMGKINASLTPAYLQHEYNVALTECAKRASCTMIVGTSGATPIVNIPR
ncbi:SPFH domain-containing protein [Cupriavidus campinensis]|uniref:SPFH domain-containing protein n=1 Tax=Cupriavidus campinensis TaxID=151783 RepID=A0ABY3ESS5_9BURK|nr:SPFH domain-containing protein [Cupriavidus campinensis]TSP14025.1 SPFH domain-containing protein [Cupriavidus campinensis]